MNPQFITNTNPPPAQSVLQYSVNPDTVYVSTSTQPMYANLTITVFNPSQTETVTCQAFQFGFYLGAANGDLTANLTGIVPSSAQNNLSISTTATVDPDDPTHYYYSVPPSGMANFQLAPQASLLFYINNVLINEAVGEGGAPFVITEATGPESNIVQVQGELTLSKEQSPLSAQLSVVPPTPITPGQEVTLSWQVPGAVHWQLYDYDTETLLYDSETSKPPNADSYGPISPQQNTNYELIAFSGQVFTTAYAEAMIMAAHFIGNPQGTPTTADAGQAVILSWKTQDASQLVISAPNFDEVVLQAPTGQYDYFPEAPNNQWTVNPVENTTYTLTITGPGNSTAQDQVTISVNPPSIALFNAQPTIYTVGQQVAFSWIGQSAVSAALKPDPGKPCGVIEDNLMVTPPGGAMYELTLSAGPNQVTGQLLVIESAATTNAGKFVQGMAYSKSNHVIWVADPVAGQVFMINGSDGSLKGSIKPTFGPPETLVYDWTNNLIWIGYAGSFTLSSINVADGSQSPYGVSLTFGPFAMAFDGTYVWLGNSLAASNNLVKALGSSPTKQEGPFSIGNEPFSLAFDGTYMWVTNRAGNTVDKLQLGNASSVGAPFPLSIPNGPNALYFDGTYMWVGALYANTVTKLGLDGTVLGTYQVGNYPSSMAFDGKYLWVVNGEDKTLSLLDVSAGTVWATVPTGADPVNLIFDGSYMWLGLINEDGPVGVVMKLSTSFQSSSSESSTPEPGQATSRPGGK